MSDVSDKKAINLTDLQRFKEKNDAKTEQKIAKAKNDLICEINAISFDPQHNIPVFNDTAVRKVIETKPNQLIIHTSGYTDMYACPSRTWNEYASHDTCDYIQSEEDNGTVYVRYFKFRYENGSYYCDASCAELSSGKDSVSGTNDGTNWTSLTINSDTYSIPQGGSGSEVSGTNDGTNWTSLTIDGETHDIPQGGGGISAEEIYPINIVATPNSTNIEIAPAQNITLADMGEEAPGYTAAPYQTLNPVTYDKPYDAVLAEFKPGHQYLLPLISADSNMLLYGLTDSSMPVFDDEHPCAIMIQLNGSSIDSVMMISGGTYGPDGTEIATSLKGYFYSDTEFSFNASGIRDTDVAAAISAGKLPVAIIEWKYKDYQSWCPIKSFDEVRYYFEGEYKENKFTLVCDGSYWRADWLPVYVEDKQLGADVDYANNKIYFRSLDAMREMQAGLPMVKLELHDYTDANRPLLGYLQLTLASQSDDKSECYYTSTENVNGNVKVTTIYVASEHTYSSGSSIYIQENEYYDFKEADMTDQAKLAEIYNLCPKTLRADTSADGIQFYRLQNDHRTKNNKVSYSCLLFGMLIDFSISESSGTYSINVIRYSLTPANNN